MQKISAWFHKISNGKVVLVTLLIFIAFTSLVLPGQAAQADQFGEEVGTVDTSMYYTPDQLIEIAEGYGKEGRDAYIRARWTFDVAWPLVYTAFLASATSLLVKKTIDQYSPWMMLNLVPLFAMLFDFLENIAASGVMAAYPQKLTWLAWLSSVFTPVKWLLVGGSFLLVIGLLIALAIKALGSTSK
ncbi:MAG: hypothetical protein ABFS17_00355 [Chloroflexota bacterium]